MKFERRAKNATHCSQSVLVPGKRERHCGRGHARVPCMKQPPELVARAYRFSLAALRFYRKLPKSPDAQVPGVQFYNAATSTWSNYRASQRGRSRAEFIAKLGTAMEESDESLGWLAFLIVCDIGSDAALLAEAKEICAMLPSSLSSARANSSCVPSVSSFYFLVFCFYFLLS